MLLAGFAFTFAASSAWAQEGSEAEKTVAPSDQQIMVEAFENLAKEKQVHYAGKISERKEEDGGMAAMVISLGGGSSAKNFVGKFEALTTNGGEFLVKSKKKLPGLTIFGSDDRVLVQSLWEKKAIDANQAKNDLTQLLDAGLIARTCKKTKKFKKSLDEETALTTYKFKLSKKMIPTAQSGGGGMGGMMPNMRKSVMAIRATIVLNSKGNIVKMKFDVTRSDPMAAIRDMAIAGGGGGGFDPEDIADLEEIEGDAAVYELERATKAPSKELLKTLESMRELI